MLPGRDTAWLDTVNGDEYELTSSPSGLLYSSVTPELDSFVKVVPFHKWRLKPSGPP